jgi:hypothetical protein
MANTTTVLIGGWNAFSEARGLTTKEAPETFGWMSESDDIFYSDARAALDATPGAREFLRSLKPDASHRSPIIDAVQDKMSPLHSGASSSCLIGSYRAALKNWDAWVLATKKDKILRDYKKKQIDFISLITFYNHLVHIGTPVTDEAGFKATMEKTGVTFSDGEKPVNVAWDDGGVLKTITILLDEMRSMKAEEDAKWRAKRLKERIEYLEWNYKHPSRWFWPGEGHPSYSITVEEMTEMERIHPAYRSHIALVCTHLYSMGHKAGWIRTPETEAALQARLVDLGIAKK